MYSKLVYIWFSPLLLLSLTSAANADWWSKTKRDIPAESGGIVIPLTTDSLGRYVTTVGMGNQGKAGPVQTLPFVLSTSSPYTAAASVKCSICAAQVGSSSLYNASLSETQIPLNQNRTFALGDNVVKGGTISEVCGFRQQNGSLWWYPNQTVVVAEDSRNFFANGAAGLVGLGRSGGDASFINTVFRAHTGWQNMSIALALNPAGSADAGVMDLRAIDSSYYAGDINYSPVITNASTEVPTNYPADWSLHLDSWTVDTGGIRTERTTGGVAIVEPYFPEIRFPQDQARLFYRDVPGAVMHDDATGLTWSIPCKPSLSLDVKFSGTPFSIGVDQLVTGEGDNCTGVVRGWDDPFVQSYMLGKAFAQTVYIVYNANRDGSGDTLGFAPRNGTQTHWDSKLSPGAVAGISVGATIAFFLLLVIAFLWWRHKRAVRVQSSQPIKEGKGQHRIQPYTPTSSSAAMLNINSPPANGAYVIEQGPIGGDVGQSTTLLSGTSPEASPNASSMSPSHRRKMEEVGALAVVNGAASGGRRRSSARPPSSGTHTSGSEFLQGLPQLPATPVTPDARAHHLSAVPSSAAGAIGEAPGTRPTTLPASNPASDPPPSQQQHLARHVSTDTRHLLSPTSPQIHYHIHVTPGAAAAGGFLPTNMPPGSIIHEYNPEEPAPEYSERPRSRATTVSEEGEERPLVTMPSPPASSTSQQFRH